MSEPAKHLVLLIFLSSLIGLCYTCPANCTSCNNTTVCYNCTEGHYGLSCERNCISLMCLNNTCNKDSGACLHGCIEGYFLYGSSCYPCSPNCKTCANFSNNCLECKDGYYGPSCQYQCSHCKDGICTRDNCTYGCGDGFFRGSEDCRSCNEHCASCSHYNDCQICVDGYFGPTCQFECTDCSPCNQDGSCSKTTSQAPTSTTQHNSPSNESIITTFSTTTRATTASSQTSHDSILILTTASSQTSHDSISTLDNTLIIYAAAGGGGGLVVIVLVIVVVVVCKRRGNTKQADKLAENIDMTENENYISAEGRQSDTVAENIDIIENENYISAEDIDEISRNSNNAQNDVKQNKQEDNAGDLYSVPNKTHRPTMVTMETRSGQETEDSPSNFSPTIPVKSNMYSDMI